MVMSEHLKKAKEDWEETKRELVKSRNTIVRFVLIPLPWLIGAYTITEWILLYFQEW